MRKVLIAFFCLLCYGAILDPLVYQDITPLPTQVATGNMRANALSVAPDGRVWAFYTAWLVASAERRRLRPRNPGGHTPGNVSGIFFLLWTAGPKGLFAGMDASAKVTIHQATGAGGLVVVPYCVDYTVDGKGTTK